MKFSIITPLYNKESFIAETIDSVLAQTYTDYEFIIVDDSSTDGSTEVVNSYKDSRIRLLSKPNGGVSAARNYGISESKGDFICFLDADDLWNNTYLETLNNVIKRFPDAGFFCCAFKCFRETPERVFAESIMKSKKRDESFLIDFFEESCYKGGSIALTSAVAICRNVLMHLDYFFPEGVNMGEDVDLWFRVASVTKTVYINSPLMLYRFAPEGGLSDTFKVKEGSYPYWKWYNQNKKERAHDFTTLMVYLSAKRYFKHGGYTECLDCLNKIKGRYVLFQRIVLRLMTYGRVIRKFIMFSHLK